MAQLAAPMSGAVLSGVVEVVGSNLARGKIFTAPIGSVDLLFFYYFFYCQPVSYLQGNNGVKICLRAMMASKYMGQHMRLLYSSHCGAVKAHTCLHKFTGF